jgi:hypothetical protein
VDGQETWYEFMLLINVVEIKSKKRDRMKSSNADNLTLTKLASKVKRSKTPKKLPSEEQNISKLQKNLRFYYQPYEDIDDIEDINDTYMNFEESEGDKNNKVVLYG